jgi:magnesium-transporting ATPase (P-type)
MAKDKEFCFMVARDSESIGLEVNGKVENYYILKVLEFNSVKKMMAVIVKRACDEELFLFVKGADVAIEPLLLGI